MSLPAHRAQQRGTALRPSLSPPTDYGTTNPSSLRFSLNCFHSHDARFRPVFVVSPCLVSFPFALPLFLHLHHPSPPGRQLRPSRPVVSCALPRSVATASNPHHSFCVFDRLPRLLRPLPRTTTTPAHHRSHARTIDDSSLSPLPYLGTTTVYLRPQLAAFASAPSTGNTPSLQPPRSDKTDDDKDLRPRAHQVKRPHGPHPQPRLGFEETTAFQNAQYTATPRSGLGRQRHRP